MAHSVAVVLIEDRPIAYTFIQECFPFQDDSSNFSVPDAFSSLVKGETELKVVKESREALKNYLSFDATGPLLLIMDLNLYGDDPTSATIRENIFREVETLLSSPENGVHAAALEELNALRGLGAGGDMQNIDGLEFGLAAITNLNLRPLIVRIATTHYGRARMESILRSCSTAIRGAVSCCDIATISTGRGELAIPRLMEASISDSSVKSTFLEHCIKNDVSKKIKEMGRECFGADPMEDLRRYLEQIRDAHDSINGIAEQSARRLLLPLLGISEDSWRVDLWPGLSPYVSDIMLTSGTSSRPWLSAAAAWLLALSAYVKCDGQRSWTEIFSVSDLTTVSVGSSWEDIRVTPYLKCDKQGTVPLDGDTSSLHQAIAYYYRMCLCLFQRKAKATLGPLEKVTLQYNSEMRFVLSFDAWNAEPPATRSLAQNIALWRDGYLKNPNSSRGEHRWSNEPKVGPNSAARSLWDWWLATSVQDVHQEHDLIFGAERAHRMTLRRIPSTRDTKAKTEIIFRENGHV